jgi:hypothetical protein
MPERPPPEVLALIVADGLHRDAATGKFYILGTYSTIFAANFPCTHAGIVVYAALSDGHGNTPIKVRLVDANEERPPVFEAIGSVNFPNPLTVVEIGFAHGNIVFPAPGRYSLQLYSGDKLLRERRIAVEPQPRPPGAAGPGPGAGPGVMGQS